jgi:hypothetical protein
MMIQVCFVRVIELMAFYIGARAWCMGFDILAFVGYITVWLTTPSGCLSFEYYISNGTRLDILYWL